MRKAIRHSVDPDDLAARLAQVPSERGSPVRHMSPTASSEDGECEAKFGPQEYQARCYQALLEEGGRPLFDVGLLPSISANVDEYHDLLRPWRLYPDSTHPTDWEVFHRQLFRWQEFGAAQLWHRGRTLDFSEYLEQKRRHAHMQGRAKKYIYGVGYEQVQRGLWEREHGPSHPQRYDTDDEAKAAIVEYNHVLKKLLEQYGFAQPFQLHLDLKKQDQWTTFVEYLGFECHQLHLVTESTQRMCPEPVAEREAPFATSTASQHKRGYRLEGDATATDDQKETHGQTAKRQKQSKTRVNQEHADPEENISLPNPALSRATRAREQKYQEAKARVVYHQHRVEWILSEISKIEAEQKSKETKICDGKPASEASTDESIVESGPTNEEKMTDRKSDDSPTAQVVELYDPGDEAVSANKPIPEDETVSEDKSDSEDKTVSEDKAVSADEAILEDEAVPEDEALSEDETVSETQVEPSNKPSPESHSFSESKKASTSFSNKNGDVDLKSAAAVSAQVSLAATGDSHETCNDERRILQPSANEDVAVTASTSSEINETQTPKGRSPSQAPEVA